MALYLIEAQSGAYVVRAKNGHHAQTLLGEEGTVMRLHEEGDDGVIDVRLAALDDEAGEAQDDNTERFLDGSSATPRRMRGVTED